MAAHFAQYKWLYLLLLPGIVYFPVFRYGPMYGAMIAFKDYVPFLGIAGSPWVGFQHFDDFFANPDFPRLLANTLILALLSLVIAFPLTIVMALLLNELRLNHPQAHGPDADLHPALPVVDRGRLADLPAVRAGRRAAVPAASTAILGHGHQLPRRSRLVPPDHRAAGHLEEHRLGHDHLPRRARHASTRSSTRPRSSTAPAASSGCGTSRCPAIRRTIIVMLVLQMGQILNTGFEQIYLMTNSLNRQVADVFDTYVYFIGITAGRLQLPTAVGLFKAVVGRRADLRRELAGQALRPEQGSSDGTRADRFNTPRRPGLRRRSTSCCSPRSGIVAAAAVPLRARRLVRHRGGTGHPLVLPVAGEFWPPRRTRRSSRRPAFVRALVTTIAGDAVGTLVQLVLTASMAYPLSQARTCRAGG